MENRETILDWTTAGIPWVKSAYIINPKHVQQLTEIILPFN
jgi:hypothetical protein